MGTMHPSLANPVILHAPLVMELDLLIVFPVTFHFSTTKYLLKSVFLVLPSNTVVVKI